MLELQERDFGRPAGGGREGLFVWWVTREGRKRPTMTLAWHDLVLLDPEVRWPESFDPRRLEGWGDDSFRLTHVKALAKVLSRRGVQVPGVTPVLALKRTELPLVEVGPTTPGRPLAWTSLLGGPEGLRTSSKSLTRAERALSVRRREMEVRITDGMALVYRSRLLRAILTTIEERA